MSNAFPPQWVSQVNQSLDVWAAWHSGEIEALEDVHQGMGRGLFSGGVMGALRRFWWGTPATPGQTSGKLHVPLAGDIAEKSANLLFGSLPRIRSEHQADTDRIEQYLEDGLGNVLREGAEHSAALGGVYLRVAWDTSISDRPWLTVVKPDLAVPEFSYGRLTGVTFWRVVLDDGKTVLRHLERHSPGLITHELWSGDKDFLGSPVPLTNHQETALLEPEIHTGIDQLTVVYVPNIRPNRLWSNTPEAAYFGRSDFAGVEPLFDALDEAWSSLMRDVRLGKARLLVDNTMLDNLGPGAGALFDTDQELFVRVDMAGAVESGQLPIKEIQPDIRVEKHLSAIEALTKQIINSCGYSPQTFGLSGEVAVTATEVEARTEASRSTRSNKISYWSPSIAEIIQAMLAIDRVHLGTPGLEALRPKVAFPEAVTPDMEKTSQTVMNLRAAQAISRYQAIAIAHPDWDDQEIITELARINQEQDAQEAPATPNSSDS
ncbi:phage portal protein [Nocardiopsis alba]|uniref:phage portal protein n=1 Tax=Nocardiopsis alba TaxID=53437 RepID=UPI00339F06BD